MFDSYTLQNGAHVVLVPLADTASITTLVMYPVGSRYEPSKLQGVSHYVEHLMFKGTKKRKNTLVLTREIDRLGAEYNAFTGKEYTGYYIKTDKLYAKTAIDILSDMLLNSVFDPKEMEREKGPIVEELKMYRDNPIMNLDNVFEELLYDGPLGRDIGGTDKHVLGYKRPDVLAYRDKFYDPSNMTILLAGAVDESTKQLVENYFGPAISKRKASKAFKPAVLRKQSKKERLVVQHKDTDQCQMMLGFPSFGYGDKDAAALSVLNTILGGSMSSRLFIQIRERRGLAYTICSGVEKFRDTGYAYIRAGIDPKNVNKALNVIFKELEYMKTKEVTTHELDDAKTHIRGSLTLSMEDSSVQANWYAKRALFYPEIETPPEYLQRIDAVSKKDILRVAKRVYKMNDARLAFIGNVDADNIIW